MNTLAARARQLEKPRGGKCSIARLLDRAADDDLPVSAQELVEALNDKDLKSSALSEALRERGVEATEPALSRHRRGGCQCPR